MAEFKGRHFTGEVILWAVRWYLMFPVSYRGPRTDAGGSGRSGRPLDHLPLDPGLRCRAGEAIAAHLRLSNGSWRVDETYIKIKGRWTYLYRAVDGRGQTIDFLLSARRDAAAAKRFFRKALRQPHTVNPRTIPSTRTPPIRRPLPR